MQELKDGFTACAFNFDLWTKSTTKDAFIALNVDSKLKF